MFVAVVEDAKTLSDTPSATYAYYHSNIKPKPAEKLLSKQFGGAEFADMNTRVKNCLMILSALYASTPHRTLRRYKKDRISGLFHCSDFI